MRDCAHCLLWMFVVLRVSHDVPGPGQWCRLGNSKTKVDQNGEKVKEGSRRLGQQS
jgi:hypothetical protein